MEIHSRTPYRRRSLIRSSPIRRLRDGLSAMDGVTLYGGDPDESGPVMSFNFDGLSPADAAYILDGYGIRVRAGLQCAPLIHGPICSKLLSSCSSATAVVLNS